MSVELQLPAGTGMQRHGHVLTLSGFWDEELLDELQHGLMDLRQALPRAAGRKLVTLHLFNFAISASAVSGALSLVRRAFVDLHTDVAVVVEGSLSEAGLLFLAGSQRGFRKVFINATIQARGGRRMGLVATKPAEEKNPPATQVLPDNWQEILRRGETIAPAADDLLKLGLIDKILNRH